jgi:HPr kinase/phosphorylase
MTYITVEQLFHDLKDKLKLKLLTEGVGLTRRIRSAEILRPGLAFSGYYDYFTFDRVQILGRTEVSFLSKMNKPKRNRFLNKFFTYKMPCIIISKNLSIEDEFLKRAIKAEVPVFRSPLMTSTISSRVTLSIEDFLSPEISMHATLLDVYGVGTLLIGKSGVGKSECALELVERGHRLVADDMVNLRLSRGRFLTGSSSEIIRHHMEIRGLGIINIKNIFGVGAVRDQKRISLVVTLERWSQNKEYERLGLEEQTYTILGVNLPHLIIPVRPGRNIPILVEVAALNQREKRMGINSAQEFNKRLIDSMSI